ncbi:ATP phosphoribosyltransferase regulatory subunit [Acidisphaera sp. L21]|uniref:ATP phosphoribosyltransferase regulatory subunit n=1 Tax=Acidisphaera sp. L21 TaxID=1641851 RepID=UPI00131CFE8A|nr:ATP phosphoribosyltransferase regulatory subunit [Acidisphaera sp. L21]
MPDTLPDALANPALLPAGLRDLLPPEAETEAAAVEVVMAVFAAHGYERIKPPLLEFEDSLLAGSGGATADQIFRLMDPDSHRMMGVRADMTPQIARIATTRLAAAARPLRLSYAGQCLRVRGNQIAPDRQIAQAGIELIGCDSLAADAEMVLVAAEALAALGLTRVSFDLTLPRLAPTLLDEAGFAGPARQALLRALDRKDVASVVQHGGRLAQTLSDLLLTAGLAGPALARLESIELPPLSAVLCQRLAETVRAIQARAPSLKLTIDPLEFRDLPYHTGVCTAVYATGRHEVLGRGGRYVCGDDEAATGLTLYPDAVLRACAPPRLPFRVFVPVGADHLAAARLRTGGFATVSALDPVDDPIAEAHRLRCTHILRDGQAQAL